MMTQNSKESNFCQIGEMIKEILKNELWNLFQMQLGCIFHRK